MTPKQETDHSRLLKAEHAVYISNLAYQKLLAENQLIEKENRMLRKQYKELNCDYNELEKFVLELHKKLKMKNGREGPLSRTSKLLNRIGGDNDFYDEEFTINYIMDKHWE